MDHFEFKRTERNSTNLLTASNISFIPKTEQRQTDSLQPSIADYRSSWYAPVLNTGCSCFAPCGCDILQRFPCMLLA
ncbi:hypothetical protein Y032_0001g292 [Ancylostoma ceylanicum]|uniref:Uncharacterized protein n=1 Tax=Ancylostoma ceylanicum TaxID=53326 RepID=A0A016W3F9_9BILA|nr:hypothetical protein Y032_0001g292 [Ancylostoma ceylanicum]